MINLGGHDLTCADEVVYLARLHLVERHIINPVIDTGPSGAVSC